ncbi:AEC family transporter [Oleiharenicola lentus]|uniref:AEC family transporter n=1 Tax=Oleiharenicola lentus TaxID=2508720 RepID=UPI003F669370
MMSYGQLFLTILPVLSIVALGAFVRRMKWVTEAGETSLFSLVVNVTFPCLIYDSVANNPTLREPGSMLLAPVLGFGLTLLSMAAGWYVARGLGLTIGHGLRTFALAVGLTNYGYLPLPILDAMFGAENRAMLFLHNIGVEAAVWTGGVLVVSGLSPREGWRKLINMPIVALAVALVANFSGVAAHVPGFINSTIHAMAVCSVPLGLLMSGVSIQPHLDDPKQLVNARITLTAWLLRLAVLPWIFLLAARYVPCAIELKRVLVVQAAMPAAVVSVIVARVYGGQPLVAVQIVLGTTALALFTIPFWIRFGLAFAGVGP